MSDLREIIVVKSVCRKFLFHSNFGLSLKERNFEDIVIFHRPKRWKSTTNSIPLVPTFRLFPSWKRKRRNYHHFQSLSLSLRTFSRHTRSQLYFVLQFPFDARHARPATKALNTGRLAGRRWERKSGPSTENSSSTRPKRKSRARRSFNYYHP